MQSVGLCVCVARVGSRGFDGEGEIDVQAHIMCFSTTMSAPYWSVGFQQYFFCFALIAYLATVSRLSECVASVTWQWHSINAAPKLLLEHASTQEEAIGSFKK